MNLDKFSSHHNVGDLVRHDNRIWRVGLLNPSRMRLDPVQGKPVYIKDGGRNATVGGVAFTDYGSPVNISPTSMLEVITSDQLTQEMSNRAARLKEQEMASKVAEMPVAKAKAVKTPKEQATQSSVAKANADRRQVLADRRGSAVVQPGEKKEKAPKVQRDCLCGCGGKTFGYFVMGHDARFKGWMISLERGKIKPADLPESVQAMFKFKKNEAGGYMATKHYTGAEWPVNDKTGYDNPKAE